MLLLIFAQSLLASPALADDGAMASSGLRSEATLAQSTPSSGTKTSERTRNYRLGAEDVVNITVFGEPDLTGSFTISESGGLEFPLLGTINVSGASPQQVTELLSLALRDGYLHDPRVTVSVEVFASQPVQVLGAVSEPGVYHLKGGTSVIQVLSEAGGI
ncbi:MAG: polysaccharide biosynthesis/export family protein, partial [Myxococcota bacterium]|nr:polysaccharide biosynthesis/export family protein [Myxococcota bacterium]